MSIAENLKIVQAAAAPATLVAVSKTWPADYIQEAYDAGQRIFGENKVQEILEKARVLPQDIEWHLIGHLQKNKIRKVIPHCAMIHSADSLALAGQISRIAGELEIVSSILLQVNISDDDAKFGFTSDKLREAFDELKALPHLQIDGLMTVPKFDADPEQVRPAFAALRELRDELASEHDLALPHLSMGMSHDAKVAVEEGATLVRVGSSIFGKRDYG
jgi:pyridoxal phosphate enzyme (YggS family)